MEGAKVVVDILKGWLVYSNQLSLYHCYPCPSLCMLISFTFKD